MVTPRRRSTIDIVVIMLTAIIGIIVTFSTIGILILRLMRPQVDVSKAAEVIGGITTTIVGALVGFIGGRAAGRLEGVNGKSE